LRDTQPSNLVTLSHIDWDTPYSPQYAAFNSFESLGTNPHTLDIYWWHPITLFAKASSIDEPRYFEEWFQAMESKLDGVASKNTYSILDRNEVPAGSQIIKSTWVLRLKRRPDGSIIKKKARFCFRGDTQELDDTEFFYAPVVDWGTVRIVLIISVAFGLHNKQPRTPTRFRASRQSYESPKVLIW
jgi:hypothetical protein